MKTDTFSLDIDNKQVTFLVKTPSLHDQREGQKIYNQAFTDAIKSGSVVRAKMDDLLESQGLWSAEKQKKYSELQQELLDGEKRLAKGGFPLGDAKKLAIRMKEVRNEIRDLVSVRTSLDNQSAEGQADNARFNYLVSVCVVYNDNNEPYFKNLQDYLDRADSPVAFKGAQKLANMMYGLDNNFEKNLPENKFLKKYRFVNDNLQFIDKQGRTVDIDGRLIDSVTGRYINDKGEFVDKDGNRVDEEGDYLLDAEPFLDDDGKPIILEENQVVSDAKETTELPAKEPDTTL
jgi:hypothetical protein